MVSDGGEGVQLDGFLHGQLFLGKVLSFGNITNVICIRYHTMRYRRSVSMEYQMGCLARIEGG